MAAQVRHLFWISGLMIAFVYLGYPSWLWLRRKWKTERVHRAAVFPFVSFVITAYNEANLLPAKLRNLLELNYPHDRMEIIVVSDGSNDGTVEAALALEDRRIRVFACERKGKAAALNVGIGDSQGSIIVFADARQYVEPNALSCLLEAFADPRVGCVSGALMLGDPTGEQAADGLGLYWRMEKKVRQWESDSSSVVGATGAFYAVRREFVPVVPDGTILDDLYIPLHVGRAGKRVLFEPRARVWDKPVHPRREFRRKIRTLVGNYQLLQIAPWVLTSKNPLRFEFVCHKLLRLIVPFALVALFISSACVPTLMGRTTLAAQALFYASAALTATRLELGLITRIGDAAFAFLLLNLAALVAFVVFVTGGRVQWGPARG